MNWHFDNSYARLGEGYARRVQPVPVAEPTLLRFNRALAADMGLAWEGSAEEKRQLASWLSGNTLPPGAEPLAQAYAGHQFGHFTMLGDGRAILLGEHITPDGRRLDVQLKGSGPTPFSRRGDGRATLHAMLREYLISEAMHHLGIPSSRSLAVVGTGEPVYRETVYQGAVLTRIASSHIRVGTIEYIRRFMPPEAMQPFILYTLARHYPGLEASENPAYALLEAVAGRQAHLLSEWMRVGFIHGVMNTDNTSLSGETFDYGPCAFMNAYNPMTVFSSIDADGRYAYANQPRIALWNLAVLAGALLPALHPDQNIARDMAESALKPFQPRYEQHWQDMMGRKLGFANAAQDPEVGALIRSLLKWMEDQGADYTNTFLAIQYGAAFEEPLHRREDFARWLGEREALLRSRGLAPQESMALMQRANPSVIPRNHQVEQALNDASERGDFTRFDALLEALSRTYAPLDAPGEWQQSPPQGDAEYVTFCGT